MQYLLLDVILLAMRLQVFDVADKACDAWSYKTILDGERAKARFLKKLQEAQPGTLLQGELHFNEIKQASVCFL